MRVARFNNFHNASRITNLPTWNHAGSDMSKKEEATAAAVFTVIYESEDKSSAFIDKICFTRA